MLLVGQVSKLYLCLPQITPELQDGLPCQPVEAKGEAWYAWGAEKALSQAFPGRVRDFCHERKMVSNFRRRCFVVLSRYGISI